jgi:hypothetical protein
MYSDEAAAARYGDSEFDLAVMTGHAFQVLVGDDEVRASLTAIRHALAGGGRLAFETRNPLARAWESWNPGTRSRSSTRRAGRSGSSPAISRGAESRLAPGSKDPPD